MPATRGRKPRYTRLACLASICVLALAGCSPSGNRKILQDANGKVVPLEVAELYRGLKHCDQQSMTFVHLAKRQYIGDPDRKLPADVFTSAYAERVPLPADARDTGFHSEKLRLYEAADQSAVYVVAVDATTAKRLPLASRVIGCD